MWCISDCLCFQKECAGAPDRVDYPCNCFALLFHSLPGFWSSNCSARLNASQTHPRMGSLAPPTLQFTHTHTAHRVRLWDGAAANCPHPAWTAVHCQAYERWLPKIFRCFAGRAIYQWFKINCFDIWSKGKLISGRCLWKNEWRMCIIRRAHWKAKLLALLLEVTLQARKYLEQLYIYLYCLKQF